MNLKTRILNDHQSVIRNFKFLDSMDLQILIGSADENYLMVHCNIIINLFKTGICQLPWDFFNKIGIPELKKHIRKFMLNNPQCEYHEHIWFGDDDSRNACRRITCTDRTTIEEQYRAIMKCRRNAMSKRTEAFFKETYQEFSDNQDIQLADSPILPMITYLNNVTIPKVVTDRIVDALVTEKFSEKERASLIDVHQKIRTNWKFIIHEDRETINYRIGGLFNSLPRPVRRFILNSEDGFIEFDLKSAHLSFLCARMNIKLPDDVVSLIAHETGLLKERVKACVVTTIYGGKASPQDALILDETRRELHNWGRQSQHAQPAQDQEKADYLKVCANPHFQAIKAATDGFKDEIQLGNGVTDCFGVFIPWKHDPDDHCEANKLNSITAAYYSAIEKRLMMKLIPITAKGFRIVSDEHDGCSVYISNPKRRDDIINRCKNAVQKEAKILGINTTLEIK